MLRSHLMHLPHLLAERSTLPISWRIHRERVLILGWGRAILMQFAHPLVAAGVAEHSQFNRQAGGRRLRANATIHAFLALSFGMPDEAHASADAINAIHRRVHGALDDSTRHFAAGTHYSAADPELEAWVHATLVDSFLLTYQRLVGPLTLAEQDRYCAEARALGPWLGVPVRMLPGSVRELRDYMTGKMVSGEIEITDTARELCRALLAPPSGAFEHATLPPMRLATISLLPADMRHSYGFEEDSRRDRAFDLLAASLHRMLPVMPRAMRYWPEARRAEADGRMRYPATPDLPSHV